MKTNNPAQHTIIKRATILAIVQLIAICLIAQTVTITGTISEAGGTAVSGVTVVLSGDIDRTTTTDANGQYVFEEIPLDVSVSITPILDQDCSCGTAQEDYDAIMDKKVNEMQERMRSNWSEDNRGENVEIRIGG